MRHSPAQAAGARPLVIGFTIYTNVTLLDFAGATQILAMACGRYQPIWLAHSVAPVATSEGVSVLPGFSFENHPPIDILFVPGGGAYGPNGELGGGVIGSMFDPLFQGFVRKTAQTANWVGSVCNGAFILAAARLLDGIRATTYWSLLPQLKTIGEAYGFEVDVHNYPRWEICEKSHRFSGGGISSSIDLALQLVHLLDGKTAAKEAQLSVQYAPKPPFDSGDPSSAPANVLKSVRQDQAGFDREFSLAVERLLKASPSAKGS